VRVVSTALRARLLLHDDLPPCPQEAGYGTLEMLTKHMPSNSLQPVDDNEVRQWAHCLDDVFSDRIRVHPTPDHHKCGGERECRHRFFQASKGSSHARKM
jgi:hypothetical protein